MVYFCVVAEFTSGVPGSTESVRKDTEALAEVYNELILTYYCIVCFYPLY